VGGRGAIAHWDGSVWSGYPQVSADNLNDVAGNADGTAWAVGDAGVIARWDGTSWSKVSSGTAQRLADVWVTGASDAWATGAALLHWNGTQWAPVTTTGAPATGTQVWASGAGDVYVASSDGLHHFNGSQWTLVSGPWGAGVPVDAVAGSGPTEVWVETGDVSQFFCDLYHLTGSTWTNIGSVTCTSPQISSPGAGEAWFGDASGAPSVWKNGTLSTLSTVGAGRVFARTSSDVWVGFQHGNGTTFATTALSPLGTDSMNAVKTFDKSNMWAVGQDGNFKGKAYGWAGAGFTAMSVPTGVMRLRGVWAASSTSLWAVGEGPIVLQSTGGAWSSPGGGSTANDFFNGVGGTSAIDVWFVGGANSRIWHWNGNGIGMTSAGVAESLNDVAAIATNDVWAVGDSGRVVHYSGTTPTWSAVTSGTTQFLEGVCANSSTDVWIVGQGAVALHSSNGSTLSPAATGIAAADSIFDVWCASATELWVVTSNGTIYRGNGSTWTLSPSPTTTFLVGVSGTTNNVWAVGGGAVILRRARP